MRSTKLLVVVAAALAAFLAGAIVHPAPARAEAIASVMVHYYTGREGTRLTNHGLGDAFSVYDETKNAEVLTYTADDTNWTGILKKAIDAGLEIATYVGIATGPGGVVASLLPAGAVTPYWVYSSFSDPSVFTAPMSKTVAFLNGFSDSYTTDATRIVLDQTDPYDKIELVFQMSAGDYLDNSRLSISAPVPEVGGLIPQNGWEGRRLNSQDGYPTMEVWKRSFPSADGRWNVEGKVVLYPRRMPLARLNVTFAGKEDDCWQCLGTSHTVVTDVRNQCTAAKMPTLADGSCHFCGPSAHLDTRVNDCVSCADGSYANSYGGCTECGVGDIVAYDNYGFFALGHCQYCQQLRTEPDYSRSTCLPNFCKVSDLGYPQNTETRDVNQWYGRAKCTRLTTGSGGFSGMVWEHNCGPREYIVRETCVACPFGQMASSSGRSCVPDPGFLGALPTWGAADFPAPTSVTAATDFENGNGWGRDPKYYGTLALADVDGDGRQDVCGRTYAGIRCWLARASSFTQPIVGPALTDGSGWGVAQYYDTIRFADVNGDGKADVCARGAAGVSCWRSTGTGFDAGFAGPALSDAAGYGAPQYYRTLRMPDVNGDGKADLCARGNAGLSCWLSTGSGFAALGGGGVLIPMADANGWGAPQYYETLRFGDLDGDGRDDACIRSSIGLHCWRSTGSGFAALGGGAALVALPDASGWGAPQYYETLRLADINGDGLDDMCIRSSIGLHCMRSTGTGFAGSFAMEISLPDANGWGAPQYYKTIRFADVNDDGMADMCIRHSGGLACMKSTGTGFVNDYSVRLAIGDAAGGADPSVYSTVLLGDVGGDGRAYGCVRGSGGFGCKTLGFSTDGGQLPVSTYGYLQAFGDKNGFGDHRASGTMSYVDINGDGRDDACGRGPRGIQCWLAGATGWGQLVVGPALSDAAGWGEARYVDTIRWADVNGDGRKDVCARGGILLPLLALDRDRLRRRLRWAGAVGPGRLGDAAVLPHLPHGRRERRWARRPVRARRGGDHLLAVDGQRLRRRVRRAGAVRCERLRRAAVLRDHRDGRRERRSARRRVRAPFGRDRLLAVDRRRLRRRVRRAGAVGSERLRRAAVLRDHPLRRRERRRQGRRVRAPLGAGSRAGGRPAAASTAASPGRR